MKRIFILFVTLSVLISCGRQAEVKPLNVIFDTDIGNDIDDVLALQMLLNYEKAGHIDLLGVTICKAHEKTIPFVDGYCRFNGRNDIPVGFVYDGVTPEDNSYLLPTLAAQYDGRPLLEPVRTVTDGIPEAYKLLRQLLVSAEDGSVTIVAVGPLTNIGRLLTSGPDEISPLTGQELVRDKVSRIVTMAGAFEMGYDMVEWNVLCDVGNARKTFEQSPVPLTSSGYEVGYALKYPHQSILSDFGVPESHPLCVAYQHYSQMPYDRECWDLTAVLEAVEPGRWFAVSPAGKIILDEKGQSVLEVSEGGLQNYMKLTPEQQGPALEALVNRTAGKEM